MTPGLCSCQFDGAEMKRFSRAWHLAHKAAHLAAFPNIDANTIRNLDDLIRWAATAEGAQNA